MTCKDQIPGFPRLKNPFPGLSRTCSIHKSGLHEAEKCIYKISYQCISIRIKKRKCNTCGNIIVLQWTQVSPASSISGFWHINHSNQNWQFQNLWFAIPGLSRTYAFFQDFPGPGILNNKIPGLSRICTNPVWCTTAQSWSNNPPSTLQTITTAQMLSVGGEGRVTWPS